MNQITFQALSEPNRFQIVELLRQKPRPVNEIVERLSLNQPQVSKHLKVLSNAGLVEVKPFAQKRYYKLSPRPFKELDTWLHRYKRLWEDSFDRLDAMLQKEQKGGE